MIDASAPKCGYYIERPILSKTCSRTRSGKDIRKQERLAYQNGTSKLAVAFVCRQTYLEASHIWYENTKFNFMSAECMEAFAKNINLQNRDAIRRINLEMTFFTDFENNQPRMAHLIHQFKGLRALEIRTCYWKDSIECDALTMALGMMFWKSETLQVASLLGRPIYDFGVRLPSNEHGRDWLISQGRREIFRTDQIKSKHFCKAMGIIFSCPATFDNNQVLAICTNLEDSSVDCSREWDQELRRRSHERSWELDVWKLEDADGLRRI